MIIVRIGGGLGNQLFQYALGRKMSLKNNDVLKLDISGYDLQNQRKYTLNNFNIDEKFATRDEVMKLSLPYGIFSKIIKAFNSRILKTQKINFDSKILEKRGDLYFDGFWQSEKYFSDITNIIRKDFTLKNKLSSSSQKMLDVIINEPNSVSLHVRRGDYVANQKAIQDHGVLSESYYLQALKYISDKIKSDLTIFVFSDDIEWVKNELKFPFKTIYVSAPETPDYEELILMSCCKHNIIAHSTFSWWGAWLNQNPEKIVVSPSHWVLASPVLLDDILPVSWIRV